MTSNIPIEVVPYNPQWQMLFELEKAAILSLIGMYVNRIEHVGSTAVPGLAAKPVIDILVGIQQLSDAPEFLPPLRSLGYEYIPEHEAEFPERRYLHRIEQGKHTHHLHIVETESSFFKTQLLFRDYLRTHPDDAERYAALKYRLAAKFKHDREAYTNAKSGFISEILCKARNSG